MSGLVAFGAWHCMPATAMQKAPACLAWEASPEVVEKDHTKSHELSLPPKPQTWVQQPVLWGTLQKVTLPLDGKCCQSVLWGRVCVSPCVAYVAVCLWMCLLLSYPAYSPSCFQQGEEGQAQPFLSTVFYTGVSACGR